MSKVRDSVEDLRIIDDKAPLASPSFTGTVTADGLTVQSNNNLDILDADNHVSGRLRNVSGGSNSLTIEADPANSASDTFMSFKLDASEAMRISSGNVGIGVVPEAWSASWTALDLGSKGSLSNNGNFVSVGNNAYNNGAWRYKDTQFATDYHQENGTHAFRVAPSGTADAAISWTTAMTIDNAGIVTTPYQPAFSVWNASSQSNIPVSTWTTILFDTEFFDQNQDFSSSTFTAPVTGKYQLNASVRFNVDDAALYYHVQIETSNASHRTTDHTRNFANADLDFFTQTISVLTDMDAGDTAFLKIYQNSGSAITDIDNDTRFSGFLAC